ncbi:MAG TPA: type II toxin-antitoxin system VapB family antitoxin [Burkholderiaceae bacterium]
MRTTVVISDPLFQQAKRIAAREGVTMRAMIELGLRKVIAQKKSKDGKFRLRPASFAGTGLRPELQGENWDRIRAIAREDRGG